ncbi:MAG: hypothetical protein JWM99_2233 [Verrucomicrobiales bacterium]|nr:hypothetical protein [Verrucomicrobiales bacterium]
MEIVTNSFPAIEVVESLRYQSLIGENSSIHKSVEILGDTDLFALFPDRPAGLIANSSGLIQLVFLDSGEKVIRE